MPKETTGSFDSKYVPPKDWEDITSDEKIERLCEIIKSMNGNISRLQTDIHHVRENFKNHAHGEKGIVVPFNEYPNNSLGMGSLSANSNKYF